MARIIRRVWAKKGPTGRRVRHVSYGYHLILPNGKRERVVSAAWGSETAALAALAARQDELAAGVIEAPADMTLEALAERYLAHKANGKKRSLRDDTRILKRRIIPAFGKSLSARALSTERIAQYEEKRLGQVSAYTVANELGVLRHMLRLARKWGIIRHVPEIELPRKPEHRQRYLDLNEIQRLMAACTVSKNPHLAAIVTIAINTGMRKAEIMGLEWERVDLSTSRITLYQTKNGKARGVPINRAVYEALVAIQPDAALRHGWVFTTRNARAWGQIRTAFAKACERAGLKGFRFHDLRHTCASHMVMRGRSLQEVKEVLGHSDLKLTLRYAHLSPRHLLAAVGALDGLTEPTKMAHKMAHNPLSAGFGLADGPQVCDSSDQAPVAQVDRAAVS
jgi:integrase